MLRKFIISLLIFTVLHLCSAQFESNFLFFNKSVEEVQSNLRNGVKSVSEECSLQLELYVNKLKESLDQFKIYQNDWAWQIFDSSGKLNAGILAGNMIDLGNFDECLAVDVVVDKTRIRGKYCYAGINFPLEILDKFYRNTPLNESLKKIATDRPEIYSVSICIPDACTPTELSEQIIGIPDFGYSDMCQTAETFSEFDASDWTFIAFIIIIAIFVIASTAYDLYLHHYKNDEAAIHPITLAFSFYTNGKKIFHTTNNPEQLSSVNGMRVFSILWVMAGHRVSNTIRVPQVNTYDAYKWVRTHYSEYIQAAPVAVDSFFFMSGVVMSYAFVKSQSKPNAKFNVFIYYLHRYLRLTPALAVVYFFYVTIVKHVTSGPTWPDTMDAEQNMCKEYWYSVFLYIQNFVNGDEMCLAHTWYLSVDIQIFLISPLILLPIVKYPKHAFSVLVCLIVVSVIPAIIIIYCYELDPNYTEFLTKYYFMPYNRIAPWLVGVLLGAVLVRLQNKKVKIPTWINIGMWILVIAMMILLLYVGHEVDYSVDDDNLLNSAMYYGTHRMLWALGLMWIVFACQMGYGGFVNWLLTLPLFQVIARLSYSMYLIHVPVLMITILRKRTPQLWDDYDLLAQCFGDIIVVTFLALFWCLLFESPMVVIEKIIFGGGKDNKIVEKNTVTSEPQPGQSTDK